MNILLLGYSRGPVSRYFANDKYYAESDTKIFFWKMASLSNRVCTRHPLYASVKVHFKLSTCSLVHYLHPSDYDLRKLAGFPQPKPKSAETKSTSRSKRRKNKEIDDKNFTVPRNLDVEV